MFDRTRKLINNVDNFITQESLKDVLLKFSEKIDSNTQILVDSIDELLNIISRLNAIERHIGMRKKTGPKPKAPEPEKKEEVVKKKKIGRPSGAKNKLKMQVKE